MNEIDSLSQIKSDEKRFEKADKIKEKIQRFRQAGLDTGGEYSIENLVLIGSIEES